jgi:hypothetical protein
MNPFDYAGDEPYDYPMDPVLLSGTSPINTGVRTDSDSDFILLGLAVNVFTSILFSIQLKDQNGNFFSSAPVLAANYQGDGAQPFVFLGRPRIFGPNSSLGVQLVNFSGAENTIQLLFRGKKRKVPPAAICGPDTLTSRLLQR